MKKILLNTFLFISVFCFSQSSRFRVMNDTKFGWTQKFVPVKLYSDSTWRSVLFWEDIPTFTVSSWNVNGNSGLPSNVYVGTQDNRSLYMRSNGNSFTGYIKFDSIGFFSWQMPNSSLHRFQLSTLIGSFDAPAMYLGAAVPTTTNYLAWSDGTTMRINGQTNLNFGATGHDWLTAITTKTTTGSQITFLSNNQTIMAASANCQHISIQGNKFGIQDGTTASAIKIAITADTYSNSGAGATVTTPITLDIQNPIAGTGVTFTSPLALRITGNINNNGKASFGGSIPSPLANIHVAAGSSTVPAIKFTSQTAVSSPNNGEMYFNGSTYFWQGSTNISGAETVSTSVTTPSVFGGSASGGTLFLCSTTNATKGAINFCASMTLDNVNNRLNIGSLTPATHTLDVVGNANISSSLTTNGIANTGSITASTTGSFGTTFTVTGASVLSGGITTPTVFGGSTASATLQLSSTSNATKGAINFGSGMTYDAVNKTLNIGSLTPATHTLDVVGNANISSSLTTNGVANTGSITTSTTFSCGTTFTAGGAAKMNGIANTGSITTSTTFSCGTTATVAGGALSLPNYTTNAVAAAVVMTTAVLNFPSTGSNASSSLTVSIPSGAVDGNGVVVGVPIATRGADLGTWSGGVTAANVVTIIYHNTGGSPYDPPSGTFNIYVFKN